MNLTKDKEEQLYREIKTLKLLIKKYINTNNDNDEMHCNCMVNLLLLRLNEIKEKYPTLKYDY